METEKQPKFDIAKYDPKECAEAGATMTVVDPLGRETDWTINLLGADSDAYQDTFQRIQKRNGKELERAKKFKVQAPEQIKEDAITLIAAATTGWSQPVSIEQGVPLAFSLENAKKLYRHRPDVLEQADAFVTDRTSFLPSSAKA